MVFIILIFQYYKLEDVLAEEMKNEKFREAYEEIDPKYNLQREQL
jgi:hypothetical protein